jgi:hypothetical protein
MQFFRKDKSYNRSNELSISARNLEQNLNIFNEEFIKKFKKLSREYANFHLLFVCCGLGLILSTLLFFSFFSKTMWSGLLVGFIFFAGFLYLVLFFYRQAKKPQQFIELKNEYQEKCKQIFSAPQFSKNYHLKISYCLSNLADLLCDMEGLFYHCPKKFRNLNLLFKKFSIWMHWKDVLRIKELLLLSSINEVVALVKTKPTDIEAHANLADAYITLSKIYIDPKKLNPSSCLNWTSPEYQSKEIVSKFHLACDRAIEELNILNEYSPNDPWVHKQLADIYHNKDCPELEINEYEQLLKIENSDKKILFRLGVLYFGQGRNSNGLKIYEQLKSEDEDLAEDLISHYDSFKFHEITIESVSQSI